MSDNKEIFISETDFRSRYQYSSSDLLGEGGFAQVYKAYDKQFNEYVALKFYNKGEQGKYDVLHEMKDSRKFSHKNIVRVHDAFVVRFEHTGGYSLVQVGILEYANGGNLRDFINTKPSESRFVEVLTGILSALEYLHSDKKIIHRDLSPENILMYIEGENWIPKIADFGISKKLDFISDSSDSKKSTQLLGKVSYMAPEQFYPEKYGIGGEINTNVDLWAFGVILYELFTQRRPFGNDCQDNPIKIIQSITNDQIPDINDIPDPYRTVIKKCLEKDAKKRVRSAVELISILKKPSSVSEAQSAETVPINEYVQKKKKPVLLYTVILSILIIIVGVYFIFKSKGGSGTSNEDPNSTYSVALSAITDLVKEKKYQEALFEIDKLPEKTREQKSIADLSFQIRDLIRNDSLTMIKNRIDSLLNVGSKLTNRANYLIINNNVPEAKRIYNEALSSYTNVLSANSNNEKARTEIQRITHILDTIDKPKPTPKQPPKPIGLVGRNYEFSVRRSPVNSNIELTSIRITNAETIITLELKPTTGGITVYGPGTEEAFLIEYNNRSAQLKLKEVNGIQTGQVINGLAKSKSFELVFNKLPDNVSEFNLLEGENRADDTQSHWNFIGIKLIK
jgi:serine/threonine protein kinase